ncbi:TRAP transporter small permease [Flagellimonas halotolerans]|uniref:TRAP transporter small permease n=1 Tax=Flagellimonas halotolerans TaxID=3112164 RepID=A0ABU6IVA9_9FLAO|nr:MULTISPECIES: TRAP transporter small permease [unclassified Allomuricauda]MEC3967005.1 TRAP transporter small permease [Muricauda sp. SYSU M86414]MEC4266868.1 TRAP transporter small permease [Muricauda sp. SYSU M84420]
MGLKRALENILAHLLVVLMGLMVLNVLWQVFSRYVIGEPSAFTDELARFLMIWLGLLGAAYVSAKNGHVAIDVLAKRASAKNQKLLKRVVSGFIILFCLAAMVTGGGWLVYTTYELKQLSPALGLPLAYVYIVIPLSGLIVVYNKVVEIIMD